MHSSRPSPLRPLASTVGWLAACCLGAGAAALPACDATLGFVYPLTTDASRWDGGPHDGPLDGPAREGSTPKADGTTPKADVTPKADMTPKADKGVTPKADKGVTPKADKGVTPKADKGVTPDQGTPPPTGYFPPGSIWYQNISGAALQSNSTTLINTLNSAGGWGMGQFRIDFSLEVLHANASAPLRSFIPTGDHYTPDCDTVTVPIPPGGAIEGESGYACVGDGDCHLLVVHDPTKKLYEMWRANITGSTFYGGCLAVWDLTKVYPASGRGEGCTSADAAGYPIAPLLFTADEVKAGKINHALRFILPNNRIRNMVYVHPATHSTPATSGGTNSVPYGVRLRLKAGYNTASLSAGAKVVAQALKTYGMFLSDGGDIAMTAQSDRFTTAKWNGLLDSFSLSALKVTDFEVVAYPSAVINYNFDCTRN